MAMFAVMEITPRDPLTTNRAQAALLRQPLHVQYVEWMSQIVRGNFGRSSTSSRLVGEVIAERFWLTVGLTGATILIVWSIGLPVGIYSALRQYTTTDNTIRVLSYLGFAIPNLLLAIVL